MYFFFLVTNKQNDTSLKLRIGEPSCYVKPASSAQKIPYKTTHRLILRSHSPTTVRYIRVGRYEGVAAREVTNYEH